MAHVTPEDQQLSGLLATLYTAHSALVLDIVARSLRPEDAQQAEDIAQDVWLAAWEHLLRGGTIENPARLLTVLVRSMVTDFYTLAGTNDYAWQSREQVAA
jgi:DNA-directed RNA polymerase specialized sigma24 family protein